MTPTDWIGIAERFGVLAVVCAAMALAFFYLARWVGRKTDWLGDEVIKPIVTRHMQFLDKTESVNNHIVQAVDKICDNLEQHNKTLEMIDSFIKHQVKIVENLSR